jgi:hypothetical protein
MPQSLLLLLLLLLLLKQLGYQPLVHFSKSDLGDHEMKA